MRTMLVALSVAAGLGLVCWQSASAAPVNPAAVQQAATSAAAAEQVQNAGYRHRHGGYAKRAGRGSLPLPPLLVLIASAAC